MTKRKSTKWNWRGLVFTMVGLSCAGAAHATPLPAPTASEKARLIVTTDIGGDPDDAQSMVRLLLYSNAIDIQGLIASDVGCRATANPHLIEERARAYGEVLPNLRRHARGYPEASHLQGLIRTGSRACGMAGVGDEHETEASQLIIDAVDANDVRPVWVTIWGGASDLAQALWTVRASRSPDQLRDFVSRLRV